jgi:hypothetical protein
MWASSNPPVMLQPLVEDDPDWEGVNVEFFEIGSLRYMDGKSVDARKVRLNCLNRCHRLYGFTLSSPLQPRHLSKLQVAGTYCITTKEHIRPKSKQSAQRSDTSTHALEREQKGNIHILYPRQMVYIKGVYVT